MAPSYHFFQVGQEEVLHKARVIQATGLMQLGELASLSFVSSLWLASSPYDVFILVCLSHFLVIS